VTEDILRTQSISPLLFYELFKQGNYRKLDEIIMKSDSTILIGKLNNMSVFLKDKQEDIFYSFFNHRLNLLIHCIDNKHYMGLNVSGHDRDWLITEISEDGLSVFNYGERKIPKYLGLHTYDVKDLLELYENLPSLSTYRQKKS
jgi:hypothetical protein